MLFCNNGTLIIFFCFDSFDKTGFCNILLLSFELRRVVLRLVLLPLKDESLFFSLKVNEHVLSSPFYARDGLFEPVCFRFGLLLIIASYSYSRLTPFADCSTRAMLTDSCTDCAVYKFR